MRKSLAWILTAAVMVGCLSGCGGKNSTVTEADTSAAVQDTKMEETTTAAEGEKTADRYRKTGVIFVS